MRFCLLVCLRTTAVPGRRLPPDDVGRLAAALAGTPGLAQLHLHEPDRAEDPFVAREAAPMLVLQLYLDDLAIIARGARHVQAGIDRLLPLLSGVEASYQPMSVQRLPADAPLALPPEHTSYLVAYDGVPHDTQAWHRHYETRHVPLMLRLPGLIGLEILKPIDVALAGTAARETCFQRNRVMFASPAALTAALQSPVRAEMRADFHALPRYTGGSTHFPVRTRVIRSPAASAR